ncbi:MAG: hypothetical protein R3B70_10275 [Polyangiaceae bacterium]
MQRRLLVWGGASLLVGALGGCAEILGLEPPGGSGGAGGGGGTGAAGGGTGGTGTTTSTTATCTDPEECPLSGLPECHVRTCVGGVCGSEPATGGRTIPCYDGPPGTDGVGLCMAGTTTCVDGKPQPCVGQVLPQQEICDNAVDEDCNGFTSCGGAVQQAMLFTGTGQNRLQGVLAGPSGELYVTGKFASSGSIGGCEFGSGTPGAFVAKLDPTLKCEWVASVAGAGSGTTLSQLVFFQGDVWAVGSVDGTATVNADDTMAMLSPSQTDAMVIGVTPAGKLSGAYLIGGQGLDYGTNIAAGTSLFVAVEEQSGEGYVKGVTNGAMVPYTVEGATPATLVAGLSSQPWVRTFTGETSMVPRALAAHDDRVLVGGGLVGKSSPGLGCPLMPASSGGRGYVFDTPADAAGSTATTVCSLIGEDSSGAAVYTAAITPVVAGQYALVGFGNGSYADGCFQTPNVGGLNVGWVRVGMEQSTCFAARLLSGTGQSWAAGAVMGPNAALVGGSFDGALEGKVSKGLRDVFVHRYSADLTKLIWSSELGSTGDDEFWGMVASPVDSTVVVVGACRGQGFAGDKDCDAEDGFLARLAP